MKLRGSGGSVINIASIAGLRQSAGVIFYAVSKAAVIQLTRVAALELARFGVRVIALAQG
nr:SDR family NAD(P)-dependent oxidoreductase [uncultured Lichenicoccus sp.]